MHTSFLYFKITKINLDIYIWKRNEKRERERERLVVELTPQKNKRIKDGEKHNTKKQYGLLYLEEPLHTFSF